MEIVRLETDDAEEENAAAEVSPQANEDINETVTVEDKNTQNTVLIQ